MQQTGVGAEGPHASVPAASASKAAVESKHVLWPPFVLPFHSLGITLNPQPGHHLHHSLPTAWAPPAPLLHLHGLGTTCTTLNLRTHSHLLSRKQERCAWRKPVWGCTRLPICVHLVGPVTRVLRLRIIVRRPRVQLQQLGCQGCHALAQLAGAGQRLRAGAGSKEMCTPGSGVCSLILAQKQAPTARPAVCLPTSHT